MPESKKKVIKKAVKKAPEPKPIKRVRKAKPAVKSIGLKKQLTGEARDVSGKTVRTPPEVKAAVEASKKAIKRTARKRTKK